jgi:hypothetical protein
MGMKMNYKGVTGNQLIAPALFKVSVSYMF